MFQKILIANRGEIALRIQRACRELDIPPWRSIRPPTPKRCTSGWPMKASASARRRQSQLPQHSGDFSAAAITGADAIHPGYGFLSENANFAEMVEAHGLTFIGPSPEHIRMMGDKIAAKAAMARSACRWCLAPTVPWPILPTAPERRARASAIPCWSRPRPAAADAA